jgi:hypothetical protein
VTPEQQRALVRARARLRLREREQQAEQPQQAQRSPQYTRAYQQRDDARRARTPEELRTGRVPGGGRDIPVPDFLQGFAGALQNFNRSGPAEMATQMFRNLGVTDDAAYWATRPQGREQAQAAQQYERDRQQQVARDQPILNSASIAASIPATAGGAGAAIPRLNMLQGGALAAGLNAPFALARQDGNLQERLPGAAQESAVMFGAGAGLTGAANLFGRTPRANSAAMRAREFEQAGVRPTMAAVAGGTPAGVTRMVSENFIAGAPARGRLQASLDDTADAARNLAGRFGQHGQPEQVGETVQRGVQRFADRNVPRPVNAGNARPESIPTRDWSFRAKANALYDRVFERIARDEAGHLAGSTGVRAEATATQQALAELQGRVSAPNVAGIVNDPLIGRIANALQQDAGQLRFQDLRALRTWVREAQARPALTQTIDNAALQNLERALTTDIYASALNIGGQTAAQQLRRVDAFYRAGQNRIQGALQAFDPQRTGGAQAYQRIVSLAREGGRQNTRQLQALRSSLRPEEWREVAATIIDDLGRPTAGNPNALQPRAFSVEQFVTNYAKLSADGRRILFGGQTQDLAGQLDNLARVAGYQKGVEAMANRSRSGVNAQNIGVGFGLVNPGTAAPTAGLLAGMALTGEMLTNPAFVRWLVSAARAGGGPGGMSRHLQGLATLAARDPALAPLYDQLAQSVTRGTAQTEGAPNVPQP